MKQLAVCNILNEEENKETLSKEKEFDYIFNTYYKRVYNYIYYRINSDYTTEDLTSQVFEKIMLKIDVYSESKSPFEVWMFAIARNVVTDYFRSIKKHKIFSLDVVKNFVSREKNPEDIIVAAETNSKLSKALNTLNIRERNIVALKFGANLKNKEIAEVLDTKENNIGVILYRTMKKLKKEIEKED